MWSELLIDYWISILTMAHLPTEIKVRMIRGSIQMRIHESIWGTSY